MDGGKLSLMKRALIQVGCWALVLGIWLTGAVAVWLLEDFGPPSVPRDHGALTLYAGGTAAALFCYAYKTFTRKGFARLERDACAGLDGTRRR